MTPSKENDWTIASDGLRARKNGAWGREKLSFLDEFVPPALAATTKKRERFYVDLFAGPGRNVVPDTLEEFDGSAIRALWHTAPGRSTLHFDGAYLVNKDPLDQEALRLRIERLRAERPCPVLEKNIQFLTHDANRLVGRIMREIHPKAYALVFADITKPSHWPWSSVRQLKSAGHESVDLYLLFPWGMALKRMLSFNEGSVEQSGPVLDRFFGTEEWRTLLAKRVTSSQSPDFARSVIDYYMDRLRALGWKHVIVARDIRRDDNVGLYKMLYASNHPAGGNIADWSASRARDDQGRLF
ncbi:MAG: three-Cys-motif partner protein TcmP [Gemmatimonadaceae bacterium]